VITHSAHQLTPPRHGRRGIVGPIEGGVSLQSLRNTTFHSLLTVGQSRKGDSTCFTKVSKNRIGEFRAARKKY
jgi:hypothetical protein